MTRKSDEPTMDPFKDILGLDVPAERLDQDLKAFSDILVELRKLRELDLTDTHPVVVFDPAKTFGDKEGT
jgi:hypothetical protein